MKSSGVMLAVHIPMHRKLPPEVAVGIATVLRAWPEVEYSTMVMGWATEVRVGPFGVPPRITTMESALKRDTEPGTIEGTCAWTTVATRATDAAMRETIVMYTFRSSTEGRF